MKLIIVLFFTLLSSCFYRAGGQSQDKEANPKWIPIWLRRSLVRDLGCPLIFMLTLWLLKGFSLASWWTYLLTFGLMFASLTTYFDFIYKNKDNFFLHGFAIGLSCIPLIWAGFHWWAILIRAILLAVSMGVWSAVVSNDVLEETGRGSFIILTLPALLI